jgi:hypothetical protein
LTGHTTLVHVTFRVGYPGVSLEAAYMDGHFSVVFVSDSFCESHFIMSDAVSYEPALLPFMEQTRGSFMLNFTT